MQVAFYVWRDLEAARDYRRAALSLEIAVQIHADRPALWVNLAADRARMGSKGGAIKALERAIEAGYRNAAGLESDTRFDGMRKSRDFIALVQKMKGSANQHIDEHAEDEKGRHSDHHP